MNKIVMMVVKNRIGIEQKCSGGSEQKEFFEQSDVDSCIKGVHWLEKLKADWLDLRFREGKKFAFRAPRTIYVERGADFEQNSCKLQVLHEVGHALLGHCEYTLDLERLKMERAAWEKARELCVKYGVNYDEEVVEAALDTYRDWLHRRSQCPDCGLTRYQGADGCYRCPGCEK